MASTKSLHSNSDIDDVERTGYLKKMKTMKKKFFVLRKEGPKLPARLEYYDSDKKFKSGHTPKRSIVLKKCFNINKRADTRVKHCLALYTKDDCFCVVLESAEEAADWLKSLLNLQHGGATEPGETPKPTFEFVWQVKVQEKGLGATYNILGPYRVCLTAKYLSLVKMGCKDETEETRHTYEFILASIRRCGASQCFFYMEVGRSTVTGAGELWMVTDDPHIATHMQSAILNAMSGGTTTTTQPTSATPPSGTDEPDLGPKSRHRSSSYNETTRPLVIQRRLTHGNDTMLGFLSGVITATSTSTITTSVASLATTTGSPATDLGLSVSASSAGSRERCDSLPCRTRTTSEGYAPPSSHPRLLSGYASSHLHAGSFLSPATRPHSVVYGAARGPMSYSPPIDCSPVSPVSAGGCSTEDSAGSSLSIDETDGGVGSLPWSESVLHHHQITRSLTDSLGGSTPPNRWGLDNGRYSGGQLLSPDDSIPGSILEEEGSEFLQHHWGPSHIEEEQEYMPMDRGGANLTLPLDTNTSLNNNKYPVKSSPSQSSYMDMSSPIGCSPHDTASSYILMSPGTDITPQATVAPPFHRSYLSGGSANHSRGSSLAEDTPLGAYVPMGPGSNHGRGDDGYVDMAPDHSRGGSLGGSSCSLTSGTPSMTNTGDHATQFSSEFHLEKVSSYFTPSEDDDEESRGVQGQRSQLEGRPARAYSLGSRPETRIRKRVDVSAQDASSLNLPPCRARALSMGAQQRPVQSRSPLTQQSAPRHHSPVAIKSAHQARVRSSAAPLSSSWSGTGCQYPSSRNFPPEPVNMDENLMELDFSKKPASVSADYLDMEISSSSDKMLSSPIFEEYVDIRKSSKPIDLPRKTSNILPLWGRDQERVSPNRGSPSRGSPNRGSSDDYLNMQCGTGRRSQPINITTNNQPINSSAKSSTSPNMFSLPGFFSRKNSSGTGTPPKIPTERTNSPSPFSSLRRRGKKNSKKNKDKRNSMSSDDTSNVTTPVGMFPFSPSTPSKSFVPEEQFAKCSVDIMSGGVRLSNEEPDYVLHQPKIDLDAKRKLSTALRPPILGQSGGKTVVVGSQDALPTPINNVRTRNSASESEYVPMHPASRRKFSDVSDTLDKTRKCVSDNILDASDHNQDYTLMSPISKITPKVITAGKPIENLMTKLPNKDSEQKSNDDYTMMSFSRTPPKNVINEHSILSERTVLETLTEHVPSDHGDYALLQQTSSSTTSILQSNSSPQPSKISTLQSSPLLSSTQQSKTLQSTNSSPQQNNISTQQSMKDAKRSSCTEDYALMIPGDGSSSPRLLEPQVKQPEISIEIKNASCVIPDSSDYALMKPGENVVKFESSFKCVKPSVPSEDTSGDYALLTPADKKLGETSSPSSDYALMEPSVSSDKSLKEKRNSLQKSDSLKPCESVRKTPSPAKLESDDYVLMTPAIKQPMLPPTDAPLSIHLNTSSHHHHSPVMATESVPIPSSNTQHVPTAVAIKQPIVTKSPSIPLPLSKPIQSTPIHIPKTKTTQSSSSTKPITSSKTSTIPKPIGTKPTTTTTTANRIQPSLKQKPINKNIKTTSNNKSVGQQKQQSKTQTRRSTSKSPLTTQPELNYASLDLPQCPENIDADNLGVGAPCLARNLSSDSSGESDVTSVGTTYAQIDFVKTQQQQQTKKITTNKQERKS